jgi:GT2 family glycosyltransferase
MNISVVVPAYNAAKTVAQTLDALLAQSVPAAEIVVVDDGSKDQTREVVEGYRDRVRLVLQPNSGPSAARNRGVVETRGEWVAFCDADDLWHPEKLRVMQAVLADRADADLVFHDFWTIVDGRVAETHATHSAQTMFPLFQEFDVSIPRILTGHHRVETGVAEFGVVDTWHGSAFRWLMLGNFLMPSTVMMRRAAFEEAGGFDANFRHAEDTEFFLRFGKSRAMMWVDCPLTGYRRAAGSLLTSSMYLTTRNGARAVERHCVEDAHYDGSMLQAGEPSQGDSRGSPTCLSELNTVDARIWRAPRYTIGRVTPARGRVTASLVGRRTAGGGEPGVREAG